MLALILATMVSACQVNHLAQDTIRAEYLQDIGMYNPMVLQGLARQSDIRGVHILQPPDTLIKNYLRFNEDGNLEAVSYGRYGKSFHYAGGRLRYILLPERLMQPDSCVIRYKGRHPYLIENYKGGEKYSTSSIGISEKAIHILHYANLNQDEVWRMTTYHIDNGKLMAEVHQTYEEDHIIKKHRYSGDTLLNTWWVQDDLLYTTTYDSIGRAKRQVVTHSKKRETYLTDTFIYEGEAILPQQIISVNMKGDSTSRYYSCEKARQKEK